MARNELLQFLKRSFLWTVGLSVFRGALRMILFLVVAAPILAAADYGLDFPRNLRLGIWLGLVAVSSGLAASGFWPLDLFSLSSRSRSLARRVGSGWRRDELRLIHEFLTHPVAAGSSVELSEAYLESAAQKLRSQSPASAYPDYPWRKRSTWAFGGVALLLLIGFLFPDPVRLAQRLFWPFRSFDMEAFLLVSPGDNDVPWGGNAVVHVTSLAPSLEKPVLKVRSGRSWNSVPGKTGEGNTVDYSLERIIEPVVYRVDWNGESSRRYTLTPVKPVAITAFDITVVPPPYTGDQPVRLSEPALAVLPGSKIQFGIEASEALEAARLTPPGRPAVEGARSGSAAFSFPFLAEEGGPISIEGKVRGAWRPLGDSYSLSLKEDKAPTITLLSPEQDLVVGEKERLPLTYEATDDVGLAAATLEWQRSGGNSETREIQRFEPGRKSVLSTFDWDLPDQNFRPGEIVRFRLSVIDRNIVTGPGRAMTPWRTLEIRSFEKAHDDLQHELEAWRGEILDALASSNALRKKLDKETPTAAEQNQGGREVGDSTQKLEDHLERIVSHMEADPLADYAVWMEHRSMQDNLSAVNKSLVPEIKSDLSMQQKSAASSRLGDLSAELERMAALSEDLSKRQKARDLQQTSEDLDKLGDDLQKGLSKAANGSPLSEADKRKVESLLSEAQKALSDIAKSLQQMPQELPEDFVNQQALKQINLAQPQDTLSKIREAMAKGDMATAMSLAEKLKSEIQSMRDQISKAHQNYEQGRSAGEMAKTMSAEQQKLDQIAKDQMDLLGKTQVLESKRMEAIRQKQNERLKALALRQQAVVERAGSLVKNERALVNLRMTAQTQLPGLTQIFKEFTDRRLDKSPMILESVIKTFAGVLAPVSTSTAAGVSDTTWMRQEETAIRDELKKPIPDENVFNETDRNNFSELEKKQNTVRNDTAGLRSRLQKLSRQTASLGLPLTQALGKAASAMDQAGKSLGQNASEPAYQSEEDALQNLMDAQSAMEQASGMASDMAQQEGSGKGGAPRIRVLGRSPGGMSGAQTAPVRIPTAEDYRPPAAFREELLKSLKEKYPEIYDDVIHKYYRRLTE